MIERIPVRSFEKQQQKQRNIWPLTINTVNLTKGLQQLYKSTKYIDRTLFKVKIYEQSQKHDYYQKINTVSLTNQLKAYIIGCYWLINWQKISISDLNQIIQEMPSYQYLPEQVELEHLSLKFIKNNKVLRYCILSGQMELTENKYFFNSYDKLGRNPLLQYSKSLKRISINSVGYYFDERIIFVQSCEGFAAIITKSYVYIIFLKNNNGVSSRFPINGCIDAKWSSNGLYCLVNSKSVIFLQKQSTFIEQSSMPGFTISKIIDIDKIEQSYLCKRIVVDDDNLVGIFYREDKCHQMCFQILYNKYHGRCKNQHLLYQFKNFQGSILYENALMCQGKIIIIHCTGEDSIIQQVHEHSFMISI